MLDDMYKGVRVCVQGRVKNVRDTVRCVRGVR